MIFVRRVAGDSMSPTLSSGQLVFCHQLRKFRTGQVVVAFVRGREVIKRISKIEDDSIYLSVDDAKHAHTGEYYAKIIDTNIMGVVFWPKNL